MDSKLSKGVSVLNKELDPVKELEKRYSQHKRGESIGVKISLPSFQDFFGGWNAPDLIIIAARPSMGKTSFILSACWESQKFGYKISFVSLEMSVFQLLNKISSNLTGIEEKNIKEGNLTPEELLLVKESYRQIKDSNLSILDIEYKFIEKIEAEARRLKNKGEIDMLVVDYLQLMRSYEKHGSREQEVANLSGRLKSLGLELDIPIIALSQLSRGAGTEARRPVLTDLRESGAIEQDADVVAFLHRPTYYQDRTIPPPYELDFVTEFIVAKGRSYGTTNLHFFNDIKRSKLIDIVK